MFDRATGIQLAKDSGAPNTAALIADGKSCFLDIFKAAKDEIGPDRLYEALKQGPTVWLGLARDMVPEVRDAMTIGVAVPPPIVDNTVARDGDAISKFRLYQGAAVSGIVKINDLPPDQRFLYEKNTYDFNPADWQISPGGGMSLYFGIEDDVFIHLAKAPEQFKFDPASPKIAYYHAWGIAGSQQFALLDHAV